MGEIELLEKIATSNFTTIGVLSWFCYVGFKLLRDKTAMTVEFKRIANEMQRANDIKEVESEYFKHFFEECKEIKEKVNEMYAYGKYGRRAGDL